MKLLRAFFVVALAIAFSVPAFAETQNVKVSGSIDAYGFYRSNYDFNKDGGSSTSSVSVVDAVTGPAASTAVGGINDSEGDAYFRTNTQVEVSADLTDNVSTVINVVNQRNWNSSADDAGFTHASTDDAAGFDIDLDLAYVQMKEIFYSPLTLTIGRQDLWFGRGFIIGNNNTTWDVNGATDADEYSVTTAFDAIRATLDFNPWTLDFVYSKISEENINNEDDIDLYIANVNYKFAEYNAVAEAYFITEYDRSTTNDAFVERNTNDTHTIGGRVQFDPISQITLGGELAYQFGDYQGATSTNLERDRDAWALDLFGTYRWDYTWKPELTIEYVLFSGEADTTATSAADYGAWNGLYRGHFYTAIGDFREFLYATDQAGDQSAWTNQEMLQAKVGIKPLDDLFLEASFSYFTTNENNTAGSSDELGWEVDLQATYDYTEDVSFGLLVGWFVPGDFYTSPNDETALDIVSSVKVTF